MTQLQQFSVTFTGKKNIPNCPTAVIAGLVYNDAGQLVADFTGASALEFPTVLATLTDPQIDELTRLIANWLLLTRAGL